jgi:serine/threonine protein kinase
VLFGKKKSAADDPLASGRFGRFYLQELINSGGMADIWLATDKDQKAYALRRLHDDLRFNFTARRRFLWGCKVLSKIHDHDGIIGYYEHGKADGALYLLMEYVEGSNLKLMYAAHDPVLLENVGNIIIDMATGLQHVHESGFMHLDFKPENVLVTRNASVRLADFDLARLIPRKPTKLTENPGTPAYMAPEQLLGETVDQRADIFAFGVATFELLTNYKPFPGDTLLEIAARQKNRFDFILPSQYNPDIPPNLEDLVLRCLAQNPDERCSSMSQVVEELKAALYV